MESVGFPEPKTKPNSDPRRRCYYLTVYGLQRLQLFEFFYLVYFSMSKMIAGASDSVVEASRLEEIGSPLSVICKLFD